MSKDPDGVNPTESAREMEEFDVLLRRARDGGDEALGELIKSCQDYLLLIANQEMGANFRGKLGASDVVQSVLALAQQKIGDFRGTTNKELLAWMRAILRNEITSKHRHFGAAKRDIQREVKLEDATGTGLGLTDPGLSPRADVMQEDEAAKLRTALGKLPQDYRTVVLLRTWEQLPFDEVGRQMNRSADAAKKLWARAIRRLQEVMANEEE